MKVEVADLAPVPNKPCGFCGRKATLNQLKQWPSLINLMVSVDFPSQICQPDIIEDIKPHIIIIIIVDVKHPVYLLFWASGEPVWPSGKALGW